MPLKWEYILHPSFSDDGHSGYMFLMVMVLPIMMINADADMARGLDFPPVERPHGVQVVVYIITPFVFFKSSSDHWHLCLLQKMISVFQC